MATIDLRNRASRLALIASERTLYQYATLLEHLLLGLADASIPVALICPPEFDTDYLDIGSVQTIRYPQIELPFTARLNRRMLIDRLTKFNPTLLHCLCETRAGIARKLARRLDVPYLLSVNSLQRRLAPLRVSSRRCVSVIVPTQSIASNIARTQPRLTDRIEHVNPGSFPFSGCSCFDGPSTITTILVAHPMDDAADFEKLFIVFRHMKLESCEFVVVLMGQGRAERRIRKLLSFYGLLQTVTIVPPMRPWRSIIAGADILVQPVPRKSFNPFLLEAMSVGTAVAACKGGVDDLIIEDQTAVVFDPRDELSIMHALRRLISKREFARSIALQAQQHIKENHSVGRMIARILDLYEQAKDW